MSSQSPRKSFNRTLCNCFRLPRGGESGHLTASLVIRVVFLVIISLPIFTLTAYAQAVAGSALDCGVCSSSSPPSPPPLPPLPKKATVPKTIPVTSAPKTIPSNNAGSAPSVQTRSGPGQTATSGSEKAVEALNAAGSIISSICSMPPNMVFKTDSD